MVHAHFLFAIFTATMPHRAVRYVTVHDIMTTHTFVSAVALLAAWFMAPMPASAQDTSHVDTARIATAPIVPAGTADSTTHDRIDTNVSANPFPPNSSESDADASKSKDAPPTENTAESDTSTSSLPEGTVLIRALIDTSGRVIKVLVDEYDDERLIEAAKDAVLKTPFTPAIQRGKPVAVWVHVPVHFHPNKRPPKASTTTNSQGAPP